jgi:hypothetical protein
MLRRLQDLTRCSVHATDGAIGQLTDAYFDDDEWAVRYLVIDTGMWLGWHALIGPRSIASVDWDRRVVTLSLTRDEVERSPRADLQHPLSRLYETEFYTHFGYPPYWDAPPTWGMGPVSPDLTRDATIAAVRAREIAAQATPAAPAVEPAPPSGLASSPATDSPDASPDAAASEQRVESAADSHVRSWREVNGYHISASDGEIGHVDDALIDDVNWLIRFIVIDTSNWIGGTSVLVPRRALGQVDWANGTLAVNLSREQVRHSPRADEAHLTGALEEEIEKYWQV